MTPYTHKPLILSGTHHTCVRCGRTGTSGVARASNGRWSCRDERACRTRCAAIATREPHPPITVKRLGKDILVLGTTDLDVARAQVPPSISGWDRATAGAWLYQFRRGWVRVAPGTPAAQNGVMFCGITRPESKLNNS